MGRVGEGERERDFFTHWFNPKWPQWPPGAGPGQNSIQAPTWVVGAQALGSSSSASQVHQQ